MKKIFWIIWEMQSQASLKVEEGGRVKNQEEVQAVW